MDRDEFCLRLVEDYFIRCRHIEEQRNKAQGFIITISLLIINIAVKKEFEDLIMHLSVSLIFLGLLGVCLIIKFHERFEFQYLRASVIRNILYKEMKLKYVKNALSKSEEKHGKKYKIIYESRLFLLYLFINILIFVTGVWILCSH